MSCYYEKLMHVLLWVPIRNATAFMQARHKYFPSLISNEIAHWTYFAIRRQIYKKNLMYLWNLQNSSFQLLYQKSAAPSLFLRVEERRLSDEIMYSH